MSTTEEQRRTQWRADLARIATQIDNLKARIDTESRTLYLNLSAEIASLQADLEALEAEVDAAGPDAHARRIAMQIEELRAQGDAAYALLRAGATAQFDPIDAEIKRLEALAVTASGDTRARMLARIQELNATQAAARAGNHAGDSGAHNGGPSVSP